MSSSIALRSDMGRFRIVERGVVNLPQVALDRAGVTGTSVLWRGFGRGLTGRFWVLEPRAWDDSPNTDGSGIQVHPHHLSGVRGASCRVVMSLLECLSEEVDVIVVVMPGEDWKKWSNEVSVVNVEFPLRSGSIVRHTESSSGGGWPIR
jgi:hypothetical protein